MPFGAGLEDQRGDFLVMANDVEQIRPETDRLRGDQGDVKVTLEKKIRAQADANVTGQTEDQDSRNKQSDVEPLISPNDCDEAIAGRPRAIEGAGADETQIVDEKKPADRAERGAKGKPASRIMQP